MSLTLLFLGCVLIYGSVLGAECDHPYVGCFDDAADRLLDGSSMFDSNMTNSLCVDFCSIRKYRFAGTEVGSQCFCGNSIKSKPKKPYSECNMQCGGSPSRICGGPWRVSVFKTGVRSSNTNESG